MLFSLDLISNLSLFLSLSRSISFSLPLRPAGGRSTWTATACDFISYYLTGAMAIMTIKVMPHHTPFPSPTTSPSPYPFPTLM